MAAPRAADLAADFAAACALCDGLVEAAVFFFAGAVRAACERGAEGLCAAAAACFVLRSETAAEAFMPDLVIPSPAKTSPRRRAR